MKMQEVITRLRETAPVAELYVHAACTDFESLRDVLKDAGHANSPESLRVLLVACSDKADKVSKALCQARASIDALAEMNREYKEKLGPRGPKKPKDAEGQQMLPGMGEVAGESISPAIRTPAWTASGRHG